MKVGRFVTGFMSPFTHAAPNSIVNLSFEMYPGTLNPGKSLSPPQKLLSRRGSQRQSAGERGGEKRGKKPLPDLRTQTVKYRGDS